MASNNYNPYIYPYQQSNAQQYSAYQTAPASNDVAQLSRQYQQPATTQVADYMSYAAQSYDGQGISYSTGQDSSWADNNYGETRETTSRAAEVLRSMSKNAYTPNSASTMNQSAFTAASSASSHANHYSSGASHSPQVEAQPIHGSQSSYSQSQPRPRSVNANRAQKTDAGGLPSSVNGAGYPSQRAQTLYNQQQQRSASPAQPQYSTTPVSAARNTAMTAAASQQYTDCNHRQVPGVETSRTSQNASASNSYNYANTSSTGMSSQAPISSTAETYTVQSTTTVDPMAVYDPWPEYQRKQEALAAQKAIEDAARAEEERIAEEARKAEQQIQEEERNRKEEADRLRQPQSKQKSKKTPQQQSNAIEDSATPEPAVDPAEALELEIRAMMSKMRELNGKDPALLARIWEEERRAKAPKSPTAQAKSTPQAPAAQPTRAVQTGTPQIANSRKKTVPKEPVMSATAKAAAPTQTQSQAISNRPGGHTIWPPEKKEQLANAAATFLNSHNPGRLLEPSQILTMLDSNPSYIELCQQLENRGLKVDRATFAKCLLAAVPDANSATRRAAPQPAPVAAQRAPIPAAVMKKEIATSTVPSPAVATAAKRDSIPPFSISGSPAATPALVAEMVAINPNLKPPANKEEAARKRNLSDLVDLTLLSEDDDMGPPVKKIHSDAMFSFGVPHSQFQDARVFDDAPVVNNFPTAKIPISRPQIAAPAPAPLPHNDLRYKHIVDQLDRKKALRRNTYNPATIARDVLLACGRHPFERQLNQHLDGLRTSLPQISLSSDLSSIRWNLIDPGEAPSGYFTNGTQGTTEEADDENDSDVEETQPRGRTPSSALSDESGAQTRVQALPEAINPFKQKRLGRPPRHSFPNDVLSTPKRPKSSTAMSASAPRATSAAAGVGYQAFRSATEYGPDGQPLPKKKGRPVGWRKAIHGSAAAQARSTPNRYTSQVKTHQPSQPSSLRNVRPDGDEPIMINTLSPSVANRIPQYQAYKCRWQNCEANLHNLETLQKHVFKVHRQKTHHNTLECLWDNCGKQITKLNTLTSIQAEQHTPYYFDLASNWQSHIQKNHIDPLSWELGDGPASGVSDAYDSEAYLSDAQGRQVTPRITVDPERLQASRSSSTVPASAPRGRGRPPKNAQEQEAHDAEVRFISQKKRIGGPGMDRGGATLVNDKRRKGFIDSPDTEELVDAED